MPDNIRTPAGSGTDPAVATDEIASVHYQKVKLALGAENVLDTLLRAGQQSMANSLPVAIAANQTPVPVDAQGPEDHGTAVGPRPVVIGAEARTAEQGVVGSGTATRLQADVLGRLVVRSHCIPEQQVGGVALTNGTSDVAVIAAQGAGVRLYVTAISIANSSTTDSIVEIKDGATVIWRTAAPQKGGSNLRFDPPLRLSADTALTMASLTAASTIHFSANGYRSAN